MPKARTGYLDKGPTRRQLKARKKRRERAVIDEVRPQVERRDGYCRATRVDGRIDLGDCEGPSEWAHFDEQKRWKTVGMEPEERHTVDGSLMLCRRHHFDYDKSRLGIEPLTPEKTNGILRWSKDSAFADEEAA